MNSYLGALHTKVIKDLYIHLNITGILGAEADRNGDSAIEPHSDDPIRGILKCT